MKKLILFAVLTLFFLSCNSTKKVIATSKGVNFVDADKLATILDMASDKDKLVFVDFYTTWCLPCKLMDEDVFPNKGIAELFNGNFINYKVDAEKGNGPNLTLLYNINVYPTLLFLDKNGKVLVRKEGSAYHSELKSLAEEAMSLNFATGD